MSDKPWENEAGPTTATEKEKSPVIVPQELTHEQCLEILETHGLSNDDIEKVFSEMETPPAADDDSAILAALQEMVQNVVFLKEETTQVPAHEAELGVDTPAPLPLLNLLSQGVPMKKAKKMLGIK